MGKNTGHKKLTPKQAAFVREYLIDLNAAAAARRAGYAEKRADAMGWENLRKPEIQTEIEAKTREHAEKLDISAERILQEYARCAFYRVTDFFNPDGSLKPLDEISEDAAAAMHGLEVIETNDGTARIKKFRLPDKAKHLEALSKYKGLFKADNDQKKTVTISVPEWEPTE